MNVPFALKLEVFVKFDKSDNKCRESLIVEISDQSATTQEYCSKTREIFLRNFSTLFDIPQNSRKILQFTYSKSDAKEGGKFVLQAEGKWV